MVRSVKPARNKNTPQTADRDAVGDEELEPGETLQEAENEIGIADWIDAETGQPAEGESPPHLRDE